MVQPVLTTEAKEKAGGEILTPTPIVSEVNHAQGQKEEIQEKGLQDASRDVSGDERQVDAPVNLLIKTARKPFEGEEIDQIPPDLLAGYLGVPTWRAQSLQAAITDLKNNVDVKCVLLQKCQVTADWRIMFVGRSDSVMDAVNRYMKFMKEEADVFAIEWQQKKSLLDDERGMTGARLQQLMTELPTNLRAVLSCFEGFFRDPKHLDRLLRELPKLRAVR